MLRDEVLKAEDQPWIVNQILHNCSDAIGFIDLYLKRNPECVQECFLKYYSKVSVDSQAILYEKCRVSVDNEEFEKRCMQMYCIERQSDVCLDVIRCSRSPRMMFKIVGKCFLEGINRLPDQDLFFTRCVVMALRSHTIEADDMSLLIKGVNKHFIDGRRKYYEHGAIVASVLMDSADFKIAAMEEAQKMLDDLPEHILCKYKCDFMNPNDVFCNYTRVENDVNEIRLLWKPRYLQDAIRIISEEKYRDKIEASFRCFRDLVQSATERVIQNRCKEALDVLICYDGCEEYKIDAISSLFERSFDYLVQDGLNSLFEAKTCLRHKLLLAFTFKRLVETGTYVNAKYLHENIKFMLSRADNVPNVLANVMWDAVFQGMRRIGKSPENHNGSARMCLNPI
ncbi:hypothetical protein OCOL_000886 [Ordospora colligata]